MTTTRTTTRPKSDFGQVRKLPSGKFQARYRSGDGEVKAPTTFDTRTDAAKWLTMKRAAIIRGAIQERDTDLTLRNYVPKWIEGRPHPLKRRTLDDYWDLLDKFILSDPKIADRPMAKIEPKDIRAWYAKTAVGKPTYRAHAYSLLNSLFRTALREDLIESNPCRVYGAQTARRATKTRVATLEELATIVEVIAERYKVMILLAAWCGMRFGELTELRRFDIDTKARVVKVRRAVVWAHGQAEVVSADAQDHCEPDDESEKRPVGAFVDTPKSDAGIRDIDIPPHLIALIDAHLEKYCDGPASLLFPAARDPEKNMRSATLCKVFYRARRLAGRPDLRFHDLRHTGASLYAEAGATLAELMERHGHNTPGAAMRYQHASKTRSAVLAAKLSEMALAGASVPETV